MNSIIKRIITETIEEYIDNIKLDNGNINRSLSIVYQCAKRDRIKSIFKNGYSREYFASAGGNFYTSGVYTTFNLKSSIINSYVHAQDYGDVIIKLGLKSYDRFFILNKKIAQEVYGDKYLPEDQLKILFANNPKLYNQIINNPLFNKIIQTTDKYTSNNVQRLLNALDGLLTRSDNKMYENNIAGFVFHGANDGDVAIIHDPKAIIPLAYSLDHGKTWKTDLLTQQTLDNSANDYDPIIFLGKEAANYIKPKTYRLLNGFMRIQRKSDGKYNFFDINKNLLSPHLWFDDASAFDKNGKAWVQCKAANEFFNDGRFYIDKQCSIYMRSDDTESEGTINDLIDELNE
jgi:hypothetical protein